MYRDLKSLSDTNDMFLVPVMCNLYSNFKVHHITPQWHQHPHPILLHVHTDTRVYCTCRLLVNLCQLINKLHCPHLLSDVLLEFVAPSELLDIFQWCSQLHVMCSCLRSSKACSMLVARHKEMTSSALLFPVINFTAWQHFSNLIRLTVNGS